MSVEYKPLIYTHDSFDAWPVYEPVTAAYDVDSMPVLWGGADSVERESLFTGHALRPAYGGVGERYSDAASDWTFIVLVIIVALASLYLNRRKMRIRDVLAAAYTSRRLERLERESGVKSLWGMLTMSLLYVMEVSLAVVHVCRQADIELFVSSDFVSYLLLVVLLSFFVLLRTGLTKMLGATYDCEEKAMLYLYNSCVHHLLGALALMPIVSLMLYGGNGVGEAMRVAALSVVGAVGLLRFVRGVHLIFTGASNRSLYLFYYLCIFEIVPPLLLLRVLNLI